jgi:hypothetical protein
MIPHQFYYQLVVLGLLWLFVVLHLAWPSQGTPPQTKPARPITPRRTRSPEPTPFAGLTHKPPCVLCEQEAAHPPAPPPGPPEPLPPTGFAQKVPFAHKVGILHKKSAAYYIGKFHICYRNFHYG